MKIFLDKKVNGLVLRFNCQGQLLNFSFVEGRISYFIGRFYYVCVNGY